MAQKLDVSNKNKGRTFSIYLWMASNLIQLSEIDRAENYVSKIQALLSEARSWPDAQLYLSYREATLEDAKARVLAARGRGNEAILAYQRAATLYRDASVKSAHWPHQ